MMHRALHGVEASSLLRLLDSAQVPVPICDPTGTIRHASPALERALDWPQGDLSGRRTCDLIHPNDHAAMLAATEGPGQGADMVHLTSRCAVRGGGWRHLAWSALRDGGSGLIHATAHDPDALTHALPHAREMEAIADIVELASDGIWVIGADGRTRYANPRMIAILGHGSASITGRPLTDFTSDPARILTLLSAGTTDDDLRLRRADGSEVWLSVSARPRHDAQGQLTSIIVIVADVTDRRAAQATANRRHFFEPAEEDVNMEALIKDDLAASVIDALVSTICVVDLKGEIVAVNRSWLEFSAANAGGGERSYVGTNYLDVCRRSTGSASDEAPEFHDGLHNVLEGRAEKFQMEYPCHAPEELRWFSGGITPLFGRTGPRNSERLGAVVSHMNITDRKLLEIEHQRLGEVARLTTNPVVITDRLGRIDWVNAAFETLTEWSLAEVRARTPGSFLQCPGTDPETVAVIGRALRARVPVEVEILNQTRSGRQYWLRLDIHPRFDPKGHHTGFIAIETDVTELLEARERAEAASAAKSAFLATMSHEIRTPLNGVLGMAELLADTPLSEEQHAMLRTIRQSGWGLLALINDILDLARIEAGKMPLEVAPFSPATLMDSIRTLHSAIARAKGIELTIDAATGISRVGDEARLTQVLHNLVGNALKFTEAGAVTLSVDEADPNELVLRIGDTGIGMTEEECSRVFEAFEQANAGTARRFGGTGLGMNIVRRLVEMMGGSVTLDSALGVGTIVTLRLPMAIADGPAMATDEPASESAPLHGLRLLVAEDNATNRRILGLMLSKLGVAAVFAADGAEAVTMWRAGTYDLVVLDISMPVMDGIAALRAMQDHARAADSPEPRAIAATANMMTDQVADYLRAGFRDTLPKPFRREQLIATLMRQIDGVGALHGR